MKRSNTMRKVKKQTQTKVGGNGFGMVKRISLMIVVILVFGCIFLGIFLHISSSMSEIVVPERILGIPETAQWHGGADGGVWINIDTTSVVNQFRVQCYFENGELWEKGVFVLDSLDKIQVFSIQELHGKISTYDGCRILFTREMYRENPNLLFKKIE